MTISDADRLRLLTPRPGRVRAILDTDTYNEIDDQFALTHLLLAPEAGTSAAHRAALQGEDRGATIVTRAFTGRPARALRNQSPVSKNAM